MKILTKWAVVACSAFLLIACSPPMPDLDLDSNQAAENRQHFKWEERKPLRKVKLAGNFFISEQLDSNLPKDKADMPINIRFAGRVATLSDVIFILEQKEIPVSYNWTVYEEATVTATSSGSGTDDAMTISSSSASAGSSVKAINSLEDRAIPFKSYKGTLKGLLTRLKKSMNISYWWEDGTIFFSTNQEYVVSVPQQQDILDSIVSEIEALGATNVSSSLTAGQIVYYAKPRAHDNLIKPFLQRISHNLSEITLQVALVQVEIKGNESKGFDWDAFNINILSPTVGTENTNNVTITPYDGGSKGVGGSATGSIGGEFFRKGISIFGTETDVSVDLAINILSTIGKTTTEQNVEMRTISGKEVTLESVNEESYVSGYDGGTSGDNPEPASPEFDTVETGLTLTFLPVFDAYNAIVTIDASIALSDRLADTVVDAGGDFGEVTVRPNIKKDSFEDIVRIPLGETVIIGGLMNEEFKDDRTAPMNMWGVNSAKQQTTKQALFMIIRPLVTLYETEGNEMKINETQLLAKAKYNYEKAAEKRKADEEKAIEDAKEKVSEKAKKLEAEKAQEAKVQERLDSMEAKLEAKHQKELKAKDKENSKLKSKLEKEGKLEEPEVVQTSEEVVEEVPEDEEAQKMEMLKMLRGIKD